MDVAPDDGAVELFGPPAEDGSLLEVVRDPATGEFREPATRDEFEEQFMTASGIPADLPYEERLRRAAAVESQSVVAILDTGLLRDHPTLNRRIIDEVDLTGEGPEDQNGHGTVVALLSSPLPYWPPQVNVKVARRNGRGSSEALVKALHWVRDYQVANPGRRVMANLSLGVYSTRFWLFECHGTCAICDAAVAAADAGVWIQAAAGNTPGLTACPATAGVHERHEAIFAIDAPDTPTSGVGEFSASGHLPPFRPARR